MKLENLKRHNLQLVLALFISLPCTLQLQAQSRASGTINGRVIDQTMEFIPYATVFLKNSSDSVLVKTAVSDNTGHFKFDLLKNGNYFIEVTMLGFQVLYRERLRLSSDQNIINLGTLQLRSAIRELNNVTITGQKQFMERRADKIVINLNNEISTGASIEEVLDKLPGVRVNPDGQISLNGQNIRIFINGKSTPLSADALSSLLKGMAASSVEKIELIAHPSSKYDAGGGAGIINLVKKRNHNDGLSGNAYSGAGQGKYGKHHAGINLNYKNRDINILLNPNYSFNKYYFDSKISSAFFTEQGTLSERSFSNLSSTRDMRTYSPNLGIDLFLSDKTTLSLSGAREIQQLTRSTFSTTQLSDAGEKLLNSTQFSNQVKTKIGNFNTGMHLQHKIDTSGREYTIDLDYFNYLNNSAEDYTIQPYLTNLTKLSQSILDQKRSFRSYSAKADYTYPLKKNSQLDFGLKSSFVKSDNSNTFFDVTGSVPVKDASKNDNFRYQENINAIYATYIRTGDKLSYNIGLRTENTWGKGEQIYTGAVFIKKYVQLFPSIFLDYKFNKDHGLNFSARKYINRPAYESLNPLVRIVNASNYTQGNPDLAPAIGYNTALTHVFKNSLFTTIDYSRVTDDFTFFSAPYSKQEIISTKPYNNRYTQYLSLFVAFNKQVTPWWYTSSSANFNKRSFKGSFLGTAVYNTGMLNLTAGTYNSFRLTKNFTFLTLVRFAGKSQDRNLTNDPYTAVTAGISQSFFNKKANLAFNVTDIFKGYKNSYVQNSLLINQRIENQIETRIARLSFTYSFGGSIKRTKESTSANEEKKRNIINEN